MSPGPLISCIVPVYNGERFIAPTIESILRQTVPRLEIVVVDDGSTDGTRERLHEYSTHVHLIGKDNGGHASARNRGIEASKGEFIAFLDADDLWHREKLARQLRRFEVRPEIGVSFTHIINFSGEPPQLDADPEFSPQGALPGYTSVTMLARRDLFDRIGLFDESLRHGNDRDWLLRAAEQDVAIDLLPSSLVFRRLHDSNRSASLAVESRAEYVRILKASLDRRRARQGRAMEIHL
jgi:glycosyltransferase involved in cell wall biosynthesis